MSDFKIEVGKTYVTRNADNGRVTIVGLESPHAPLFNADAPYLGDDDEVYSQNGRFNAQAIESEFDLVAEVT